MTGQLYYAISALPLMDNKWGAPHFCFGEDFHELRSRVLGDTCGDHPHSPVVLAAGIVPGISPYGLAGILAKLPRLYRDEFEARLSALAHRAMADDIERIPAEFTAWHGEDGSTIFREDEIRTLLDFIVRTAKRGQELLVNRDIALR